MTVVSVEVQNDFLERLAAAKDPIVGVAELIWNALDADAKRVDVTIERNEMGGIEVIQVRDDGHGIAHAEALDVFRKLGDSWKKREQRSKEERRILHGKDGQGRYKAFGVGDEVRWSTTFRDGDQLRSFTITGQRPGLRKFEITDPVPADGKATGTTVEVLKITENFTSLDDAEDLALRFALYLREYPQVRINVDGVSVDAREFEERFAEYDLEEVTFADGSSYDVKLVIIEWKKPFDRALYYCDEGGFTIERRRAGVHAPEFDFTAYVKSEAVPVLNERSAFAWEEEEIHPDVEKLATIAKEGIRNHFRGRRAELAQTLIDEWKAEEIYPYKGEPKTLIERTERQVFDVVAKNVHDYLPDFDDADVKTKRFSFRLLRQAIESSPNNVQMIIKEVLELPEEKAEDLACLLERTTLTAIINASKVVADRLDFLHGLEILLFEPKSREELKERSQLQKILEEHTWIFGEEFALSVADQGLAEVLRKHLKVVGRDEGADHVGEVLRPDGKKGIVDLMLSRRIPQPRDDEREHLVIELKRPSQKINVAIIDQIRSYALAVAEDERFRDTKTRWVFWVVANDTVPDARRLLMQRDRPFGLIFDDSELDLKVWAVSWSRIIEDCRARLRFFQKSLEYAASDETSLAFLRQVHDKYLPPVLVEPKEPAAGAPAKQHATGPNGNGKPGRTTKGRKKQKTQKSS